MGNSRLDEVRTSFLADLESAGGDGAEVEKVRIAYAGKKSGVLNELTAALRELPSEEKRAYGQALNELKQEIESKLAEAKKAAGTIVRPKTAKIKAEVHPATVTAAADRVDVTLPGIPVVGGAEHPVHIVRRRIEEIFLRMGYDLSLIHI